MQGSRKAKAKDKAKPKAADRKGARGRAASGRPLPSRAMIAAALLRLFPGMGAAAADAAAVARPIVYPNSVQALAGLVVSRPAASEPRPVGPVGAGRSRPLAALTALLARKL